MDQNNSTLLHMQNRNAEQDVKKDFKWFLEGIPTLIGNSTHFVRYDNLAGINEYVWQDAKMSEMV